MKPGPPSSLTPDLLGLVCDEIKKGNFRYVAFARAGIPKDTWTTWVVKGNKQRKKGEVTIYTEMLLALEAAEATMHSGILTDVLATGTARDKLEFLRLRFNKLYNKNPNARIDDETGAEENVSGTELLAEKLAAFVKDGD